MRAEVVVLVSTHGLPLQEDPGLSSEMDEGEIVPSELFSGLGLLVVESRVPHLSPKGHVEGPHVPPATGYTPTKHVCSTSSFLCGRMEAARRQMQVLWKNHIPMCIEVLLFPDCEHGSQLAALQDVTLPSGPRDACILLEQWTVQLLPRRGGESVARARELFQAMKSYLHFSQLSAWLNLTQGKAPRNVSYRVSPPAEFCTSSFQEAPEWHTFPVCGVSKSSVIKVTVGSLPRHSNIIHVPCTEPHPLGQFVRTTSSGASIVPTKAPCRPQQTLYPPQDEPARYRHRLSPGTQGPAKQRKSPCRDRKAGYDPQQGAGREGQKQQPPASSGSGGQVGPKKMAPSFQTCHQEDRKSQAMGESRGRGRESPGVPTHLDFSKIRNTPPPFCDMRQFLLPPKAADPKPDRSMQMSLFPQYPPHPMYPPPQPYSQPPHHIHPQHHHPHQHHHHQHQHHQHHQHHHHPPQHHPPQYLDPSMMHQKRSSPAVPRMDLPYQPYNAFLYSQPRLYPQTPEDMPSYHPMQHLGAIPKRASFVHKSPPDTQTIRDLFPYNPPFPADPGPMPHPSDPPKSLKAESPKVLFSKKSPGQVYYAREEPCWVASVTAPQPAEGSDGSSPEIDKFLRNMSTSVQPLSPEEIQNYLSKLSFHQNRNQKDISPSACRSLTEKDFASAETHSIQTGEDGSYQQQLPTKLAKALEEANKDMQLSTRSTKPRPHTKADEDQQEESTSPDDRSVTPTPSLPPVEKEEDAVPKLQRTKTTPSRAWAHQGSPTVCTPPRTTESKSCQTESPSPERPPAPGRTPSPAQCARSVSLLNQSPRSPSNKSPRDRSLERVAETVAVHKIQRQKRPMSPLTKQLRQAEVEKGCPVPRSTAASGTMPEVGPTETNGVTFTNGSTGDRPSQHADTTTNGHTTTTTCHVQVEKGTASSEDVEICPTAEDALESLLEDNENNNCKPSKGKEGVPTETTDEGRSARSEAGPPCATAEGVSGEEATPHKKATPLLQTLMKRDLSHHIQSQEEDPSVSTRPVPTPQERASFRRSLDSSTNMIFHAATGLPLQSSPAPIKKRTTGCFDYDSSLNNIRAIKNSLSCANLEEQNGVQNEENEKGQGRFYSASAPASTNCLLGNFEESLLNGRIEPSGVVEGFTAEIGASGAFCPKHVVLPVTAFFFNLSDDNAPSPYLGHINLDSLGRRGYHVPKKGTVQVTLFNPNKTVVKMFVVMYNLGDMPPNCQTFLRQRTLYMPVSGSPSDLEGEPVFLRYLIHLRFTSSKSGKIYLHTDIRMIFARDKFEYDSSVASYELRSLTEGPVNPKFSPKR